MHPRELGSLQSSHASAGRASLACIVLCLACGDGGPVGSRAEPAPSRQDSAATPENLSQLEDVWLRPGKAAEWTGDLDAMIERGFVRFLAPANRTHYFVDGARERGIAAESARAFEEMLNERLATRDAVRVVVIPVRPGQLLPLLMRGFGDVAMGNLTITPERQKLVDFSPALVSGVQELVVTAPSSEPVATSRDLSGREIWVRRSSSYRASLAALSQRFVSEGLEPIMIRFADETLGDEEILEMVNADLYPATVVDSHKLEWLWAKVFDGIVVSDVAVREKGEIAAAIRKDSPLLAALVTDFARRHRAGTAFGNTMIERYFKESRWIHNATSTKERRKFDAVVGLFRKYSEEYGFDHLMMIAQGYQESRLDPTARSSAGAVGIMQIMPETAAGAPLFMHDVESPDRNIQAGIKYMRHIVDEYFSASGIDELNRHLFAFAAYNAGPTRVARLRRLAPEYGLDPNTWFKNVEYVVARKVGREPVRYVGNVYKYYLAYRRLRQLDEERALARAH